MEIHLTWHTLHTQLFEGQRSYWYQECGTVATIVEGEDRYPAVLRFEKVHSAGFATNNFACDELVEVRAPPKAKARRRRRRLELATKPSRWATTIFRRIRFDRVGRGGRARGVALRLLG